MRTLAIMIAGIGLYVWQKESEKKRSKSGMARILRNEIRRVLEIIPGGGTERITSSRRGRIPDGRVYNGLLQTGNIQFFSDVLQDELYQWYSFIENFEFDGIDYDLGASLVRNLEEMERKNTVFIDRLRRD